MNEQKKINLPLAAMILATAMLAIGFVLGQKIERNRVIPLLNSSIKVMTEGNRGQSITLPEHLPLNYVKEETVRQVRIYLGDDQVK